jgi:hypothetical protein
MLYSQSLIGLIPLEDADALEAEARAVGRYIIGRPIDEQCRLRYARAVVSGVVPLDERSERLLRRAIAHPWLLGLLDGAAAIEHPSGPLRRRFLLMFAILETSPEYSELFLPRNLTWRDAFSLAWTGARGVGRGIAGVLLLRLLR